MVKFYNKALKRIAMRGKWASCVDVVIVLAECISSEMLMNNSFLNLNTSTLNFQ